MVTRREFLGSAPFAAFAVIGLRSPEAPRALDHPDPRPGIDSSGVLGAADLPGYPDAIIEIYDMIREIPEVADGIGCGCACPLLPNYRSLLTCFHQGGMASGCPICQTEARVVYRRHSEGQSLDQIRRAIDARFG